MGDCNFIHVNVTEKKGGITVLNKYDTKVFLMFWIIFRNVY